MKLYMIDLLLLSAVSVLSSHASLLPQTSSSTAANINHPLPSTNLNLTSLSSPVTNLSDYREQEFRLYQHNAQIYLITDFYDENRISSHAFRTTLSEIERAVAAEAASKGTEADLTGPVKAHLPSGSSAGCWIIANSVDQARPMPQQKLTYGTLLEAVQFTRIATKLLPFDTYVDILEGVDLRRPGPRIGTISIENSKHDGWDEDVSVS